MKSWTCCDFKSDAAKTLAKIWYALTLMDGHRFWEEETWNFTNFYAQQQPNTVGNGIGK